MLPSSIVGKEDSKKLLNGKNKNMSFEQTIQDLYLAIADIREYICNEGQDEEYLYPLISSFQVNSARTIDIPNKSFFCVINCSNGVNLSRILDRESNAFDEYTFRGFGSFSQGRITQGEKKSLFPFQAISSSSSLFLLDTNCQFVHINLVPNVLATLSFYRRDRVD